LAHYCGFFIKRNGEREIMKKEHCCGKCMSNCGTNFKRILRSGRIIFFCSENCVSSWEKTREEEIKKNEGQK